MIYRFLAIITLTITFNSLNVFAQNNDKDLDKVDIYTKYKPELSDVRRVESQPELKEPEIKELKLNYSFPDLRYKVQPAFTPIAAQAYRAKPNPFVKGDFVKIGFGNYSTPLIHLELHNGKSENYSYGINAYHLSSSGKPKYKTFMDDNIQIHGAKFMNGKTLSGQLGYTRNAYNYYGYSDTAKEVSFKKDSIKQALNNITGNIHFDNTKTTSRLKTALDLDFYRFSTIQQNEIGYRIANKMFGKVANGELTLNAAFEGFASGPDSLKYNRNFIDINPTYTMRYKEVDLLFGAFGSVFIDSAKNKFYLYPQFKLDYFIVPERMKAFFGIGGNLTKGSTRTLYTENPFLAQNQPLENTSTAYSIYAGIKGKLKSNFDYNLEISQQFINKLPLYISDTSALRKFKILYDDVNLFKFQAGLNYSRFDKFNIGTSFIYYAYKGDVSHAYQRPDFEWNTKISGIVAKKLALHGKFYVIGSRYGYFEGAWESEKLSPIADINIGADYRYKKNISFFIDINNLTNQTYQRWFNYPVYGLNGVLGVTFSLK